MTKTKKINKEKTQNRVYYEKLRKDGKVPVCFWIEKELVDIVTQLAKKESRTRTDQIKYMLRSHQSVSV